MLATPALANEAIPDQYAESLLYAPPIEVIPHVWVAVGQTAEPNYENAGHNNNLGFIVTGDGVVVVNAGGSALLAEALHDEIKKVTDEPVKLVINQNGRGHAMLGNSYWAKLDVPTIAHDDAAFEFDERGYEFLKMAKKKLKDRADGTDVVHTTDSFVEERIVKMGRFTIRLRYLGPALSPGNIAIPGHGTPTNMAQVRRYTRDYLSYLRKKVRKVIKAGDGLADAYHVDQSPYAHLDLFEKRAKKNAGEVFKTMEWE